jgi:tetratricopeptide (TPR) repeat protein
VIYYSL